MLTQLIFPHHLSMSMMYKTESCEMYFVSIIITYTDQVSDQVKTPLIGFQLYTLEKCVDLYL